MSTPDKPPLKERIIEYGRLALAEFIGTGLLVFLGCMSCMSSLAGHHIPIQQIAWVFGVIVTCVVQTFGHISGGHVNPAVSLAAVIIGHLPYKRFPLYLVSQCLGAIVGFSVLKALTPSEFFLKREDGGPAVCSTVPNPKVHVLQAMGAELMITYILILICCGVWDQRNADKMDSLSIKLGFAIAGLAMACAPWSGSSMNPARSLAPALINNDWNGLWIYWVGPLTGSALAAVPYRYLFAAPKPKPDA